MVEMISTHPKCALLLNLTRSHLQMNKALRDTQLSALQH